MYKVFWKAPRVRPPLGPKVAAPELRDNQQNQYTDFFIPFQGFRDPHPTGNIENVPPSIGSLISEEGKNTWTPALIFGNVLRIRSLCLGSPVLFLVFSFHQETPK